MAVAASERAAIPPTMTRTQVKIVGSICEESPVPVEVPGTVYTVFGSTALKVIETFEFIPGASPICPFVSSQMEQ